MFFLGKPELHPQFTADDATRCLDRGCLLHTLRFSANALEEIPLKQEILEVAKSLYQLEEIPGGTRGHCIAGVVRETSSMCMLSGDLVWECNYSLGNKVNSTAKSSGLARRDAVDHYHLVVDISALPQHLAQQAEAKAFGTRVAVYFTGQCFSDSKGNASSVITYTHVKRLDKISAGFRYISTKRAGGKKVDIGPLWYPHDCATIARTVARTAADRDWRDRQTSFLLGSGSSLSRADLRHFILEHNVTNVDTLVATVRKSRGDVSECWIELARKEFNNDKLIDNFINEVQREKTAEGRAYYQYACSPLELLSVGFNLLCAGLFADGRVTMADIGAATSSYAAMVRAFEDNHQLPRGFVFCALSHMMMFSRVKPDFLLFGNLIIIGPGSSGKGKAILNPLICLAYLSGRGASIIGNRFSASSLATFRHRCLVVFDEFNAHRYQRDEYLGGMNMELWLFATDAEGYYLYDTATDDELRRRWVRAWEDLEPETAPPMCPRRYDPRTWPTPTNAPHNAWTMPVDYSQATQTTFASQYSATNNRKRARVEKNDEEVQPVFASFEELKTFLNESSTVVPVTKNGATTGEGDGEAKIPGGACGVLAACATTIAGGLPSRQKYQWPVRVSQMHCMKSMQNAELNHDGVEYTPNATERNSAGMVVSMLGYLGGIFSKAEKSDAEWLRIRREAVSEVTKFADAYVHPMDRTTFHSFRHPKLTGKLETLMLAMEYKIWENRGKCPPLCKNTYAQQIGRVA